MTDPTNNHGPAGTYGCACQHADAVTCAEQQGDDKHRLHQGDYPSATAPCTCLCHRWRAEDERLEQESGLGTRH